MMGVPLIDKKCNGACRNNGDDEGEGKRPQTIIANESLVAAEYAWNVTTTTTPIVWGSDSNYV